MENPIKMDDLGVPLFLETPKYRWNWWNCDAPTKALSGEKNLYVSYTQTLDVW